MDITTKTDEDLIISSTSKNQRQKVKRKIKKKLSWKKNNKEKNAGDDDDEEDDDDEDDDEEEIEGGIPAQDLSSIIQCNTTAITETWNFTKGFQFPRNESTPNVRKLSRNKIDSEE